MSNLFIDGYMGARYDFNKAKNNEKFANDFGAAMAVAGTGITAYGVNTMARYNPKTAVKIYKGTDKYAAIGLEKTSKYGKQFLDFINKNKYVKIATDKIGEWFMDGAKRIGKTKTGKNIITKLLEKIEKFCTSSSAKRGKYMLIGAGIAAIAGTLIHIVRQHDRNDGAIDQKYKDINTLSAIL